MVYSTTMKSFLGVLILLLTALGIILTIAYHTSVNAELRFVPRVSHEEYINTRRSYRPRRVPSSPAVPNAREMHLPDDDTAEEVQP